MTPSPAGPSEHGARLHVVGGPGMPAAAGWEEVYRDNVVPVYRFVYARTGNRPDAEDITAQTFLRALPRLRLEAPPGQVRAYLLRAARSSLAEHWVRHYASGGTVELGDDIAASPEEGVAQESPAAAQVGSLLARLPDTYRRVLELRFLSGCSIRETAAAMTTSVANAKVIQWRALRRAAALGMEERT